MARRRPLTPQQLAEIQEAARRGPDGKMLRETIQGTPAAPEPAAAAGGLSTSQPNRRGRRPRALESQVLIGAF